jgi:signal transduction histidine kinase
VNQAARSLRAIGAAPDRLLWAVRVRWLVIVGFFCLAAIARFTGALASLQPCAVAAVVGLVLNSVDHLCVRTNRYLVAVTLVAIPMDHVLITYVVVNTGDVVSPFIMMYFVQVVTTAMLVDTGIAVASAGLAVIAWTTGVVLIGTTSGTDTAVLGRLSAHDAGLRSMWAAFLLYCLGLLVYVGGYIGARLRSSEEDLAEKNLRLTAALDSLQAAYDKLKEAESRLVHSEKMRSLGQLVAGVAHELNNPISFISANVDHLRRYVERLSAALQAYAHLDLPSPARDRIDRVHSELRLDRVLADLPGLLDDCEEGARRSKEIVGELRTFSRNDEAVQWRTADLRRGLDSTIGLLEHRLKNHITIHRRYCDDAHIECVPGQINQVFMNMIANAGDAIGERAGNIWIDVTASDDVTREDCIQVAIRDDGAGMAPQVSARIFEPFFTTKEVGQGTGLGLAVCYAIVQRHRGQIVVESVPGMGTTFFVILPRRQPSAGVGDFVLDPGAPT